METLYNEWFGTVSKDQFDAYRKFHVTPAEHDDLVDEFGEGNHEAITKAVKERSPRGFYDITKSPRFLGGWMLP